ncbi:hypothetical protein Dsin_028744 [Dipteronia sinensis]|uniref:Uncharacterized protein n=1 Tax=Dipteronia sinensis TaxID=43782 RepID=A0AAD9ZRA5_9ROSI|nr:hypothetical protein Dsin_028744 [Dipteronia sinensis]
MSMSKWDLKETPKSSHSNIQSFLDSVTPTVPTTQTEKVECFSFKHLWEFYLEWSIYGAGAPIILQTGDKTVQYYSPTLSALQISTNQPVSCYRKSETSLDHEHGNGGIPYCQFNEPTSPYSRIPFSEKVYELAKSYPALLTLKSTDVSADSWMSVAWYPIYQIPQVTNVKELSASFLTYHKLSTSSIMAKGHLPNSKEKENMSRGSKGNNLGSEIKIPPFAMASYKMFGTLWTNLGSTDQNTIHSHLNAAASWLNQQNFWHPDFDFFVSRCHRY